MTIAKLEGSVSDCTITFGLIAEHKKEFAILGRFVTIDNSVPCDSFRINQNSFLIRQNRRQYKEIRLKSNKMCYDGKQFFLTFTYVFIIYVHFKIVL